MKSNQRLKYEREQRGWSQAKVAEEVGTTVATVGRWERGLSLPYPFYRERLCSLFGKSLQELGLVPDEGNTSTYVYTLPFDESAAHFSLPDAIQDPIIPFGSLNDMGLVGRDTLLHDLKRRLCTGKNNMALALAGLPGVGKTSLAVHLVHDRELKEYFQDGILWAALGPQPNVLGQLSRWGSLLEVPLPEQGELGSSTIAWAEVIRSEIGARRMLLVIDDAWAPEDALALKVGGPQCAYVLTTRFPQVALHFASEDVITVQELGDEDGVELLEQLAPDVITNDPMVTQSLVSSVGGLPLALTLIGKYLRMQGYSRQPRRIKAAIDQLLDAKNRLQVSLPYLPAEPHPSLPPGTPLSMHGIIEISDQVLDKQARAALYALSVFPPKPNSFSEEAASMVCGQTGTVLDVLTDAGLLESRSADRYAMHQMIADYARARLSDSTVYRRLVDYWVRYVEKNEVEYETLAEEINNILAALDLAYERGMYEEFVQGICTFAPFLCMQGIYSIAQTYLLRAHEIAKTRGNKHEETKALCYLAEIVKNQGDYAQAAIYIQEGLPLARQVGDVSLVCRFLCMMGAAVLLKQKKYDQAKVVLLEALELARQRESGTLMCRALWLLGGVEHMRGNYEQAKAYSLEGLDIAHHTSERHYIIDILTSLGFISSDLGETAQAEIYWLEGLELARQVGHRARLGSLLNNLGSMEVERGDYEQAEIYVQEGLDMARQAGHQGDISWLLATLGELEVKKEDYELAAAHLQESLGLADPTNAWLKVFLLSMLGEVAIRQGNYVQAETYLREGLELASQSKLSNETSKILYQQGICCLEQHRYTEAEAMFRDMLVSMPGESSELTAKAYYGLARIAAAQGDVTEARRLGEVSLSLFEPGGHIMSSSVKELLATLSS